VSELRYMWDDDDGLFKWKVSLNKMQRTAALYTMLQRADISSTIPTGEMSLFRLAGSWIVDAERRDMTAPDDATTLDRHFPMMSPRQSRQLHGSSSSDEIAHQWNPICLCWRAVIIRSDASTTDPATSCCDDSPNQSWDARPITTQCY